MSPGIKAGGRLRKPGDVDRFCEGQVMCGFAKIGTGGGFRPETAIAEAGAIQILGENPLLAPKAFQFPSNDALVKFGQPVSLLPMASHFDELLGDG